MIELCVRKAVRLSPKDNYKLKELSRKTKLSESDVIRFLIRNTILKEAPPKEFYVLLNKINNIGNNINQITKHANAFNEVDYDNLKIYFSTINNLVKDIRQKYL
jgi:hypothetical protein